MPPSNRKVVPPLAELNGKSATLPLIALVMNEITVPFWVDADGSKCLPCSATVAEGLLAVPARNRGSSPGPKMKSWEIWSRRP